MHASDRATHADIRLKKFAAFLDIYLGNSSCGMDIFGSCWRVFVFLLFSTIPSPGLHIKCSVGEKVHPDREIQVMLQTPTIQNSVAIEFTKILRSLEEFLNSHLPPQCN